MPDDFLNIWVVVHDKASDTFDKLSRHIKDADAMVNRMENSIGKLANSSDKFHKISVQSLQDQLNLGKSYDELARKSENYKKKVNELAETHKNANRSMLDSIKKTSQEWEKEAQRRLQIEDRLQKNIGAQWSKYYDDLKSAYSEDAKRSADSDKRKLDTERRFINEREKLAKQSEAREISAQKVIGRHWDRYYRDMEAAYKHHAERYHTATDRNAQVTSRFGNVLSGLSSKFHSSSQSSNTFYVRILGLRLQLATLGASLPPLIAGLVQLGGLLTALGSAAALAGTAIGGALVASMAQAAPVIGLLVVAFKQLFDIIKLSGEQQKQNIANQRQAADRSLALKRHLEQERQAHIDLANAQRGLTVARREALRNIQDLNQAEQDALRSSQRATLGLIGSQAALAGLVSGGGSALDIANAQLDVRDATSNVGASKLTANRAAADAARARRQGVGGNPQVIAAQQAIISQQHQMILSELEYANSLKHTNIALDDYHRRLKMLDPAQRKLFDSVVALRKEFRKEWKSITDPITNAFTGIVQGITKTLKDPAIKDAFRGLSGATGGAITQSTSFFGTPEAKRLFLQVIDDAKKNLPLIANILRDISVLFLRIAVAAGPFVHIILKNISDFFDKITLKTQNSKQLSDFFTQAFAAANAFWGVLTGVFDIFMALGTEGGIKTGVGLVGQLANYLHGIAQELRGNKTGVGEFFDRVRTTVGDLGTLLDHVLHGLIRIEKTNAFDTIIKVVDQIFIPVLINLLVIFGRIIDSLGKIALAHPGITQVGLSFVGILIIAVKVIPVLKAIRSALLAVRTAYILMATQATLSEAAIAASALPFLPFLGTILLVVAAVAAVAAAIYLLDKRFHFIHPTVVWLSKFVRNFGQAFIDAGHDISHAASVVVDNVVSIFRATRDFLWKAINLFILPYKLAIQGIFWAFKKIGDYILNSSFGDLIKSVWSGIAPVLEPIVSLVKDIYGWMLHIESVSKRLLHLGRGTGAQDLFKTLAKAHPDAFKAQYGEQAYQDAIKGQYSGNAPLPSSAGGRPGATGPLGVTGKDSKIISTVAGHHARALGNWQSDNAVDIFATPNTPVYAIEDGVIGSRIGHTGGTNPLFAGERLTLQGSHNSYFYQHLKTLNVKAGQAVKRGDILGYSGALDHVHFATKTGDPNAYLSSAPPPKTTTSARRSAPSTTSTSSALNTDPTRTTGAGSAVPDIIRAAQATGIDPAVFLATALTESGARYGAVGDKGTSYGPYQHHKGGALGSHTAAWANSYAGILERAQQFKRLQITSGAGAAALQRPADPAGYAAKVNANLARARQLIADTGGIQPTTSPRGVTARGPGVRGGAATEIIPGARNLLVDIVTGIKVNVWNALDQIALGFKNALGSKSVGYKLMISSITALDQLFTNQARNLNRLISKQKATMVQARYRVSGASGNTSVVDQGSDLTDARQNLANLGIDRDSILGQFNDTTSALTQFRKELSKTPNNKKNRDKRILLAGTIKRYEDQQQTLQDQLTQNTLDIVNAQTALIQTNIDLITSRGNQVFNNAQFQINLAKLTGVGKGGIPGLINEQINALGQQHKALYEGPLQDALAQGNVVLYNTILNQMTALDEQIIQLTADRFDTIIAAVDEQNQRAMTANDIQSRLANLGGNSFNTLGRQTGVLQSRQQILSTALASNQGLLGLAETPAQQLQIQERINELTTQLAENANAIRDNSEQLNQARVDRINTMGSFRGGINSGVNGLVQSLAGLTGAFDMPGFINSLTNQQSNLKSTGAGLRGELQKQFGINLSSDPGTLIQQLNNTDFGALEFGMDDNTRQTFEGLINSIIDNATALVDNTSELKKANNQQMIQDWSSSLWSTFRDALFTGNGGILGGIPQAATGAHILSAGLMRVHAGETISPAGVSKYEANPTNIQLFVDNSGPGDLDTLSLTKRLAFEMKTRG